MKDTNKILIIGFIQVAILIGLVVFAIIDFIKMWNSIRLAEYNTAIRYGFWGIVLSCIFAYNFHMIKDSLDKQKQLIKKLKTAKLTTRLVQKGEDKKQKEVNIKFTNTARIFQPLGLLGVITTKKVAEQTSRTTSVVSSEIPENWSGKEVEVEIKVRLKEKI